MNPSDHDQRRRSVSRAYAEAVSRSASEGAAGCCCGGARPAGSFAQLAGYPAEELDGLPPGAVESAFGCGNPTSFADVQPGQTVLDLGSGAGIDLLLAARKVGPTGKALGVDMTDEMIERARANAAAAGLANVEVRKGLVEQLPVADGSVDWVISNCVINLSPEKDRVFREIARVLRSGGRMLVSDIVVEDLPADLREDVILYNACVAGADSERDYVAGLEAAGLVEVEVVSRLVYDHEQIAAFFASDPLAQPTSGGCCGSRASRSTESRSSDIAETLEGHVWSARISARKPG